MSDDGRVLWLADAARSADLRVVEVDGWRTRGAAAMAARGIVCHHTGGPTKTSGTPSLRIIRDGREGLAGPLSQIYLTSDGTVYVVASGVANHAGKGSWRGLSGNASVIGIEAEHPGVAAVPWPDVQLDAYRRLCAALCRRGGIGPAMVCLHKEWAPTRKIDPIGFDGPAWRAEVAALVDRPEPTRPEPPTEDDDMASMAPYLSHASSDSTDEKLPEVKQGWAFFVRPMLGDAVRLSANEAAAHRKIGTPRNDLPGDYLALAIAHARRANAER